MTSIRRTPVSWSTDKINHSSNQPPYAPKTVRNYISSIFRKLQVADRSQAIVVAREAGIEKA